MNTKALTFYGLSLVAVIVAVYCFLKSLNFYSLLLLVFGVAAVLLFRQGVVESKKQKLQ